MGDINCDLNTPLDNNTKHLNNILSSFGYSQLIKDATRTTKTTSNIIDHIITNRPDIISSSGVRPCGISDHDALFLIRNTRAPKLKAPPKVITVRKYKRLNMVDFQSDLTLPYLGDFGTFTAWGGGRKCPRSIFSLFFKLCQPNLVRGNNVQK